MRGRAGGRPSAALLVLVLALVPRSSIAQEIEARFDHRTLAVGETTILTVVVRGGAASGEPEFELPAGLEVLGSGRSQNFSWVNGRMSSETMFRYEISAIAPGSYRVGPIDVRIGGKVYRSGLMAVEVTAAPQRIGGQTGTSPAALIVEVIPASPWVGQPVTLRVRLVQRVSFAEDPSYNAPTTTGFWTDRPSAPESYYADEGRERVLVTETRTRLYPVAAGVATIGEATAAVVVGDAGPFGWLGLSGRALSIRSRPVPVHVRALPTGAPASFTGAVGDFDVSWGSDRNRGARDVPVTVWLEIRGKGNVPLIRPPTFEDKDVEIFANSSEDSLPAPGSDGIGLKRFEWTVLPRRQGSIAIEAPEFAWFDPGAGAYRRARPAPVVIEVGPALFAGTGVIEGFPTAFVQHPVDPGAQEPEPWAWALGGLMMGAAVALWRAAGRRGDPGGALRAQQLEWLRAVGTGSGPDFWRAADEASAWLEAQGREVRSLREQIAAARYGGSGGGPDAVRRRLVEQLSQALPAAHPRLALRVGAGVLALGAITFCVLLGPRRGEPRHERLARAADQVAQKGEVERARAAWSSLWTRGLRHPGLAARLAWSELQSGDVGPSALWVLRGQLAGPRDPGLKWITDRVREAGGLVGSNPPRLPLTRLEWSLAALLLGALAGATWPKRRIAVALVLLTIVAGATYPMQGWLAGRRGTAVVLENARLDGSGLELQAGQVVGVRARERDRVRVAAGRVVSGWLPARVVGLLAEGT